MQKIMTLGEFEKFYNSNNCSWVEYSTENQPNGFMAAQNIHIIFNKMFVSKNLARISLSAGAGTSMSVKCVKHVIFDDLNPTFFKVVCGDSDLEVGDTEVNFIIM